ncbi:hypothetical protein E3Q16_04165 [Wallemia mellicola]|nr:hypothetical protein E3Q16_04165 [Wallemia mellicola]
MASIVVPIGYSGSSCGYCGEAGQRSKKKESYSYGFWAVQLSCKSRKNPDRSRTCCPQYTIKLDVQNFKTPRTQRQELHRFNRWIIKDEHPVFKGEHKGTAKSGDTGENMDIEIPSKLNIASAVDFKKLEEVTDSTQGDGKGQDPVTVSKHRGSKSKGKNNTFDLLDCVQEAQNNGDAKHKLEVTIERASYTEEKYELFKKYQTTIHHETIKEQRKSSFKGFLIDGPLKYTPISYSNGRLAHLPSHYGQYHHMYRVDGKLIAMGVIDILQGCVSSVYLMYDPAYQALSLGKISALFEISLAAEMTKAGAGKVDLYMGYYIHDCVKMKYKATYQPSYLLDAVTNEFYPYKESSDVLEKYRWASFAQSKSIKVTAEDNKDDHGSDEEEDENLPVPSPAGFLNPRDLPRSLLNNVKILDNSSMSLLTYFVGGDSF